MWIDPDFNVVQAATGIRTLSFGQTLIALPIKYLYPETVCIKKTKSTLSIDQFDLLQNGIGDCWLLSALSTLAASTTLIDETFVSTDDVAGVTVFRLLGNLIYVDHMVPVLINYDGTSEVIAAKITAEGEFWPLLYEKAVVKLFSKSTICPSEIYNFNLNRRVSRGIFHTGPDYVDINGGFPRWILSIILNIKLEPIQTKYVKNLLETLRCSENECLVACACTSTEKNDSHVDEGFVYGHAYSVLRVDHDKKLIRVRNPWGKVESTKYDDDGVLNGSNWKDDGEFYIDVRDFKERFPVMCFAKIRRKSLCSNPYMKHI